MVGNPETPGISPDTPDLEHSGESSRYRPGNYGLGSSDTPDLEHSGENSGYRPGNYRLGSPDTPGINPDTAEIPDFSPDIPGFAEVWASGCLG